MSPDDRASQRLERFLAQPRRAVWIMALPMIGSMLVHVLYSVVDTAFVGRLGPQALAGMTLVFPLFMILIAVSNGIGSGISVLVSQAIGRRDIATAERIAGTAIFLGLAIGSGLTLVGLLLGKNMVAALGASDGATEQGWRYFQILVAVAPLILVSGNLRFILTGQGDARAPLVIMVGGSVVNLVLDPIFIFTLDLGIRGAALASVCAQLLSTVAFLVLLLFSRRSVVRVRLEHMRPRLQPIGEVLRLGLPSSLSVLTMAAGSMLLNHVVARFGDTALAAYGAAARIDQMVAMPLLGLASAAVAIVGMFAGAARADLVRHVALYVFRWALTIALLIGVSAFASSHWLMRIFTQDVAVIATGQHYLAYMLFAYPMMAIGIVSGRLLLGLGYPGLSLFITAIRLIFVAVPVAYISVLVFATRIDGVWSGILAGGVVSTITSIIIVHRFLWRRDPTLRAKKHAVAELAQEA